MSEVLTLAVVGTQMLYLCFQVDSEQKQEKKEVSHEETVELSLWNRPKDDYEDDTQVPISQLLMWALYSGNKVRFPFVGENTHFFHYNSDNNRREDSK